MKPLARCALAVFGVLLAALPASVRGQSFVLDPLSASLTSIPATPADILSVAGAPPTVAISAAELGLLPGDVIDALSYGDDDALPAGTIYFSVDRASTNGGSTVVPPDVGGEAVVYVPAGTQGEAASDIFSTNDPACTPLGSHNQMLDGNSVPIGPPSACGWDGYGLGLVEGLPTPAPPFSDDLKDFDFALPGRGRIICMKFSLAPGSPSLTPGTNPKIPGGARPADILETCPNYRFTTAAPECVPDRHRRRRPRKRLRQLSDRRKSDASGRGCRRRGRCVRSLPARKYRRFEYALPVHQREARAARLRLQRSGRWRRPPESRAGDVRCGGPLRPRLPR